MNRQSYAGRSQVVSDGRALRLEAVDGELAVREGRVWITRRGDLDDHVLGAGESMRLSAHDRAVIEQWRRDQPAMFDWQPGRAPRPQSAPGALRRAALAWPLRGVAFVAGGVAGSLRRAEAGFAALARSAAASARRAQGCMSAGDSMASAGTVQ